MAKRVSVRPIVRQTEPEQGRRNISQLVQMARDQERSETKSKSPVCSLIVKQNIK